MDQRSRAYLAGFVTLGLFLLVQLGALALVQPFLEAGFQTVENPSDPTNSLLYVGVLLVFTAIMLVVLRAGKQWVLRLFVIFTSGFISWYVFAVVVPPVVAISVDGSSVNLLAVAAAVLVALALYAYPEWYVIDIAGIIMGAGAAGLFGISFGVLPAIILLTVLAVYDAISVYGTKHMLTLASGVMDMKIPVILVVPLSLSYSFREFDAGSEHFEDDDGSNGSTVDDSSDADQAGDEMAGEMGGDVAAEPDGVFERDAFFIGLGDAVMPTVMVASAAVFSTAPMFSLVGLSLNLPALLSVVGTMVGLAILMRMVMAGRPHAGLPLLNGGAILGYLLGALLVGIPPVEAVGLSPYL